MFLFEKKNIEKYSKRDREIIVEMLRKGVSQLTRLRHPKILSVLHPLEESRYYKVISNSDAHSCILILSFFTILLIYFNNILIGIKVLNKIFIYDDSYNQMLPLFLSETSNSLALIN